MRGKFLAHFLFRLKWVSTSSKDAGKSAQWGTYCVHVSISTAKSAPRTFSIRGWSVSLGGT